jgi:hypothetical protein
MRRRRAWSLATALGLAALGALACASPAAPVRSWPPTLAAGDTNASKGYEKPPVLRAADAVPPELRSGPHHHLEDAVATDGFMPIYSIASDFGEFQARGDAMLHTRLAEIRALATLRELSAGEEFGEALGRTLKSPFVATWNLVTKPVKSITGVPRGAAEALRRTSELARGERGELEDSALGEFFGFEESKRQLAHRLGVDPYSSNPVLQEQLNRFAWVSYVGGFGAMLVPFTGNSRPTEDPAQQASARAEEILRDYAPEDLRRLNRIELAVMGIPEERSQAFITHPWYSPRQQSLLVAHLAALDLVEGRAALIDAAARATSEEDAVFYARTAELLRVYHENVAPLERLAFLHDMVIGLTDDGRLVAPLAFDYAVWTRPLHVSANTLRRSTVSDRRRVTRREILASGSFSPKARAMIEERGIVVTEQALERLRPAADGPAPDER